MIAFTQGMDIKLENHGLINVPITFGDDGTKNDHPKIRQEGTNYGYSFVKFIR